MSYRLESGKEHTFIPDANVKSIFCQHCIKALLLGPALHVCAVRRTMAVVVLVCLILAHADDDELNKIMHVLEFGSLPH